jgi:hypothetical protein
MPIALRAAVDITSAFSSACSPKFPMPDIKIDTYKDQEAKAKIPRRNSGMMV